MTSDIESGINKYKQNIKNRRILLGVSGLFLNWLKYQSRVELLYSIQENPNFISEFSEAKPGMFHLWRGLNDYGSSVAGGMVGVAMYKYLLDKDGNGGVSSDLKSVFVATMGYTTLEFITTLGTDIPFSFEDVVVAGIAASATILVDRLIRRRRGVQDDLSLPE